MSTPELVFDKFPEVTVKYGDARRGFEALVQICAQGVVIKIVRRGVFVAALVPPEFIQLAKRLERRDSGTAGRKMRTSKHVSSRKVRPPLVLDEFSAWPTAWDAQVQTVFRKAADLGIRHLYVKEKLGGLRIQGGGKRLLAAVLAAEKATDRICATCGANASKPKPPSLPICSECAEARTTTGEQIKWSNQILEASTRSEQRSKSNEKGDQ